MRRCRTVLAAILVLTACSRGGRGTIVLGLAGPFSQPRGVSMQHAAELAVKEINARGGIRGRQLALRVMDDSGRPDVALRIAQELADDPAGGAVVGHLTSSASLAAGGGDGEGPPPPPVISPPASPPPPSRGQPPPFPR